jgi:hypothetical protein
MKFKRNRGAVLLATLIFVTILTVAASSILALSLFSHRLALRNDLRAQAKAVAETEMDWIFYQFMNLILEGTNPPDTAALLAANLPCDTGAQGTTVVPTTDHSPYLEAHRTAGWIVRRSVVWNRTIQGQIPSTQKRGTITYIDVRVEVLPPASSSYAGTALERVGRYFSSSRTSIFQYAIFYQGDLEMAPGGSMTINGDISANGSIYMGAGRDQLGFFGTLQLNNMVRYLAGDYFNKDTDGNTVYRKPGTPTGGTLVPPVFGTDEATQVQTMTQPENLLGGLDAAALASQRPDLFPTVNDVYRSLIAPPPDDSTPQEYPNYTSGGDDPTINAARMYTRAALRITVNDDGSIHFRKKGDSSDCDSNFVGVVAPVQSVYDQREGHDVYVSEIDLAALSTQLAANYPAFSGTVYVNLKNAYAVYPSAIRLKNGASAPAAVGNVGFSVATNGGIYVLGNYNTTTTGNPPAMLMGDAVTLLSTAWNDANAAAGIGSRTAVGGATIQAGILTGNVSATPTIASGGAQNLLRYLENWTGIDVQVTGSLGRLFDSKYYIQPWQQPGSIYIQPHNRNFTYDSSFQTRPPPDSPTTTDFTRGGFFNW